MNNIIKFFIISLLPLLLLACGPGGESGTTNNVNNVNNGNCTDSDNDTICDSDEGREENRDSDQDGIPDYLDTDSDNDGISDAVEAGDADKATVPVDSDFDGKPDFIDPDSDGNGISDAMEGTDDIDGDGIPNYADLDNDGDFLIDSVELGDMSAGIPDTDNDGTPDYNDIDSDNDGIGDVFEGSLDADGDGTPNFRDTDSDGDGILDQFEGGTNGNVATAPIDSDNDGHPDFLDADSDNDGLADNQEDVNHNGVVDPGESDPKNADTDDDGVSDLIEVAAGTDPLNAADNPRENGDFVFLEPYNEDPEPWEDVLNFSTAFQAVDIYFMIDYSGSMSTEITSIRGNIVSVINSLVCAAGEDPSVTNCIPDLQTGTGHYGGQDGVDPDLFHDKDINAINLDVDGANSTQSLLISSAPGWGNELHIQAMSLAVTGSCGSDSSRTGLACYRQNALRLLIMATDEPFTEDPVWPSSAQPYMDNVANANVSVIGVYSSSQSSTTVQENMCSMHGGTPDEYLVPTLSTTNVDTAACNALSGNPFYNSRAVIYGEGTTAANAITCAVQAVTAYVPQNVSALILNDPSNVDGNGNPVDAPTAFIDYVEVYMAGDSTCPAGYNTSDTNSDSYPDRFDSILPGNPVCWKIHVKQNVTVEPALEPLMFTATVEVHGAGGALLDTRDVYFLVPPHIEGPGIEGK
ncbi:hypothetical protein KKF84_18415 [Myxococcota bacterium]|nr:hypothetical protein [Myxococcota bacterium]